MTNENKNDILITDRRARDRKVNVLKERKVRGYEKEKNPLNVTGWCDDRSNGSRRLW